MTISFRGGNDYTWVLSNGALEITTGRRRRADARLNADPATFALSSLGRISDTRAGLTGGVVAYGRKPWRLSALGTIAVDGV